jgi:hypothetical protein
MICRINCGTLSERPAPPSKDARESARPLSPGMLYERRRPGQEPDLCFPAETDIGFMDTVNNDVESFRAAWSGTNDPSSKSRHQEGPPKTAARRDSGCRWGSACARRIGTCGCLLLSPSAAHLRSRGPARTQQGVSHLMQLRMAASKLSPPARVAATAGSPGHDGGRVIGCDISRHRDEPGRRPGRPSAEGRGRTGAAVNGWHQGRVAIAHPPLCAGTTRRYGTDTISNICWFTLAQLHWSTLAPSAVEAPATFNTLPLCRLTMR